MKEEVIPFESMTPIERQNWADFTLKEKYRHYDDIDKIDRELKDIEKLYGIKPRHVWVGKWIEI